MIYRNLSQVVSDLERHGMLRRIDTPLSARLEVASVQRRVFERQGPALLFTNVTDSAFPMLGNLYGTMERARFLFRSTLRAVEKILRLKADPLEGLRHPLRYLNLPGHLLHALPKTVTSAPVLAEATTLSKLPQLISWPLDGGGFITLPQVYTEAPDKPGYFTSNLGMYRVQVSGGGYAPGREVGMHYQIHRGIGVHHAAALARGESLPVTVSVGGPPALALAAMFPLPEGIPELCFAGVLAGQRIPMVRKWGMVAPAEADFVIHGVIRPGHLAPEGPFGDHLGYYSQAHDFPVLTVREVRHRKGAIWPFTSVGRPPQEDTIFGEFTHELTKDLIPTVFHGVREVHAVDAAGVHPLLLAVGSERYTPYESERVPRELLTSGLGLLGQSQTSLAKYVLIAAHEDGCPPANNIPAFFDHILRRTDFRNDLHLITRSTMDTLDYTGLGLNRGSKIVWAAAGSSRRDLAPALPERLTLPDGWFSPRLFAPGILIVGGRAHDLAMDTPDPALESLAACLEEQDASLEGIAMVVVVDEPDFASATWNNFLWVTFTRSDPATDTYGLRARTQAKHWGCDAPLIVDARLKSFQAPALEPDPDVEKRIDALGAVGGPLHGLV